MRSFVACLLILGSLLAVLPLVRSITALYSINETKRLVVMYRSSKKNTV